MKEIIDQNDLIRSTRGGNRKTVFLCLFMLIIQKESAILKLNIGFPRGGNAELSEKRDPLIRSSY